MMTKSETISQIMQLNPSVGATFLSEFSNEQLVRYLKRLRDLSKPERPERLMQGAHPARSGLLRTA